VLLGKDRLGRARELLRTVGSESPVATRELARATLREIDGAPQAPELPAVPNFETQLLEPGAFSDPTKLDVGRLFNFLQDGRPIVRANAATAIGALGPAAAAYAAALGAVLRDDDERVRLAAARAIDKLGDEGVVAAAGYLVVGLRGSPLPQLAEICRATLAARKGKVERALLAGLETSDEAQGLQVAALIAALPNARELLFVAFDGPAQNVQINAAYGIGLLGAKAAGPAGRQRLVAGLTGPFTPRREAMVKALALLDQRR
jgi:HEAT repeat protein